MSSTMISRRILSCLLLALLSQYADAKKAHYMESISTSLQHIERMLKQIKQNTELSLNCLVPADKLFNLISENQMSSNESNETKLMPNSVIRRALDLQNDIELFAIPKKQRRKNRNRNANANVNTNVNENINANYHANRYHRRAFDDNDHNQNKNVNFNSNMNRNRGDIFGLSEEDES